MEGPKAHVPVTPAATQQTLQPPTTKKRPFQSDSNSTSNYVKIRALVRDLRPQFIQVNTTTPFPLNLLKILSFSWNINMVVVLLLGFTCLLFYLILNICSWKKIIEFILFLGFWTFSFLNLNLGLNLCVKVSSLMLFWLFFTLFVHTRGLFISSFMYVVTNVRDLIIALGDFHWFSIICS